MGAIMKKLIVNADDFGLHEEINKAIIQGYQTGCITSTSIMPGGGAFAEAVSLSLQNPRLGVGIHLTLVGAEPVSEAVAVPSLVDDQGQFFSNYQIFLKRFISGKIALTDIRRELTGQIEKVLSSGITVTHLDSHQHLHIVPGIIDIVLDLARHYKIPALRIPDEPYGFTAGYPVRPGRLLGRTGLSFLARLARRRARAEGMLVPDHFFGMLAGGDMGESHLLQVLEHLPEGVSEIMLHPGYNNSRLNKTFFWNYHWEEEYAAAISEKIRQTLVNQQICLLSFGDLKDG